MAKRSQHQWILKLLIALVFFVILILIGYYARAFGTHPKFRPWLIEEAKKRLLVSEDQAFIPEVNRVYPVAFETFRTTRSGLIILLRPAKIGDEPLMKDFYMPFPMTACIVGSYQLEWICLMRDCRS